MVFFMAILHAMFTILDSSIGWHFQNSFNIATFSLLHLGFLSILFLCIGYINKLPAIMCFHIDFHCTSVIKSLDLEKNNNFSNMAMKPIDMLSHHLIIKLFNAQLNMFRSKFIHVILHLWALSLSPITPFKLMLLFMSH